MIGVYLQGLERHGVPYMKDGGYVYLSLPERLPHQIRDDTSLHPCMGDETVLDLALSYFRGRYADPVKIAFAIAQFQETPILDMSVPLVKGRIIEIPSDDYLDEIAYGEALAETPQI